MLVVVGILSESLASAGADVTGIDQGDKVIQIAKLHAKESGVKIKYKHINIEDFYKNTDERFDVITCLEMLEHVPDPNSIINTCSKLLKPGGKIFFSTINKNLKAFLFAIIGAEYILNLLPKGTHEYKKFIKPSQLQAWTSRNKLVLSLRCAVYFFFSLTISVFICGYLSNDISRSSTNGFI